MFMCRLLITSSVCGGRENIGKGCGIPLFPCLCPVIPAKSVFPATLSSFGRPQSLLVPLRWVGGSVLILQLQWYQCHAVTVSARVGGHPVDV